MSDSPDEYFNVSHSALAIAIDFGGALINGAEYRYNPETDTLVRKDVLIARAKEARRHAREQRKQPQSEQPDLFS